ncbi:MAG: maleylacetoacetate isomerase, partial [Arenicellales bacterium]|nr:maleylacetoacetate isomerase [Arenicellales bacterium]
MILYDYFRSSAAYRVRIALNLKSLPYQQKLVSLARGEHNNKIYKHVNPQGLVPAMELDDGTVLTQSLAICEYLDEIHPQPALLPAGSKARARVRALAGLVACDIHPVNNLRILKFLTDELGVTEEAKLKWYRHWVSEGFVGLEAMLQSPQTGAFCHGDAPTLADV